MTGKTNVLIFVVKLFNIIGKSHIPKEVQGHEAPLILSNISWLATKLARSEQPTAYPRDKERDFCLTASLSCTVYHHPHPMGSEEGKGVVPLSPTLHLMIRVKFLNTFSLHIVSFIFSLVVCFLEDVTALEANY